MRHRTRVLAFALVLGSAGAAWPLESEVKAIAPTAVDFSGAGAPAAPRELPAIALPGQASGISAVGGALSPVQASAAGRAEAVSASLPASAVAPAASASAPAPGARSVTAGDGPVAGAAPGPLKARARRVLAWASAMRDALTGGRRNSESEVSARPERDMETATSLDELEKFPMEGGGLQLVEAMKADRFYSGNPFSPLKSLGPVARVLSRPVASFTRTIYRTTENVRSWNSGYDYVRYDVVHTDGSRSVIDAFKKSKSPFDHSLGGVDLRPLYHQVLVSEGNGRMSGYLFEDGKLQQQGTMSAAEGAAVADGFIESSLKSRGLTKLSRPDEMVYIPSR